MNRKQKIQKLIDGAKKLAVLEKEARDLEQVYKTKLKKAEGVERKGEILQAELLLRNV